MNQAEMAQAPYASLSGRDRADAALLDKVRRRVFRRDPEYQRYARPATAYPSETPAPGSSPAPGSTPGSTPAGSGARTMVDFHFATDAQPHTPNDVFSLLHWGGLLVFVSPQQRQAEAVAKQFDRKRGFVLETPVTQARPTFLGLTLPTLGRPAWYFTARKVQLIQPGQITDRFTYSVELEPGTSAGDPYVVRKEIPRYDNVLWRLSQRFPDENMDVIAQRARKLVDHVFPVFLSREAAILNILQRDLPAPYRRRVPHVVGREKDNRGFVRCLHMNWLRIAGQPLSQLEFARQSADLLQALHDKARVIHLDLRLDNFVITEEGVGFVDFGSAVRQGEDISQSRMLTSLFGEMMRTSQIQRLLGRMKESGKLTSREITVAHGKVDKAVDFFYLAVQFNKPHHNPDLRDLIRYDPDSPEAKALSRLTDQILRPANPADPAFRSARDILAGIEAIERELGR